MKNTTLHDARRQERRQVERRRKERRAQLEFASPEWIEHVQKSYNMWPKYDRRTGERRQNFRRNQECRRRRLGTRIRIAQQRSTHQQLLSNEEKQAIRDIIRGG